jgi:hypothetical protein
VVFNNASPACPIRKLSTEQSEKQGNPAPLSTTAKPRPSYPSRSFDLASRPPRSPKNKNRVGVPYKNQWRKIVPNKKASIRRKASAPIPAKPTLTSPESSTPPMQEQLLTRRSSEALVISPAQQPSRAGVAAAIENVPQSSPPLSLVGHLKRGPLRGLSKTLGIDISEQAPICPKRRPSKQSDYTSPAPPPKPVVRLEHFSEHSKSTESTYTAGTLSTGPSSLHDNPRDIFVLPPPPPELPISGNSTSPAAAVSATKKGRGGGRPILFQRLTKRR